MNINMLGDRVLVIPDVAEDKTPGGLFIPEAAKKKPSRGRISGIGPGKRSSSTGELQPMPFQLGDTVLYSQHAGFELTLDGVTYIVLTEGDILCRLKD